MTNNLMLVVLVSSADIVVAASMVLVVLSAADVGDFPATVVLVVTSGVEAVAVKVVVEGFSAETVLV